MNEYQSKTTKAKLAKLKKLNDIKKAGGSLSNKQHNELLASIGSLQSNISALEASLSANGSAYTESQKDLLQNFTTLREILEAGLNVNNIKDIKQAKEIIVTNLKDIPKPVVNTTKTEIPKWLASEKGISKLNDNVIKVVQALIDLEANIKPSQDADNFVPFRRVIRSGNRLIFDDTDWANRGGGGSSSSGGSTGGLTDAELRASAVPVSISSDIEIGAVELKNGTDDTRATITAGNALKVDGSATTQPVSGTVTANLGTLNGAATAANQQTDALTDAELRATPVPISGTVTATPTGTQNVDVTANTIGLATSAKQDTLLTELQLKADLTETQPVSLASVPTHAVTQSGTWTEANSAAIKTAVETIDNAISGSEMQVDVVGALPAGNNNIGDVDVASSALPTGASTSAKQDTLITNTGASTPFVNLSADIGVDTIKASAGVLNSIEAVNTNTVDCIVVFYDIAGAVTVGVSAISYVWFVPKGDGTNYGASSIEFPNPLNFANAIKYATVTTAFADPTNDLVVCGSYI